MKRCPAVLSVVIVAVVTAAAVAEQPIIGFEETLVSLPREFGAAKGYRVDKVNRGTHAARLGLERGDIIVYIDTWAFENEAAFDWIMGQVGKTAQIGIINVRDGKLKWLTCRFNHVPHGGPPPRGVGAVNFGVLSVITIYNQTRRRLTYELRHAQKNDWSQWESHVHKYPDGGWQFHSFRQAEKVQIRFDRTAGAGAFKAQVYDLDFKTLPGNQNIDEDDGRAYYFEFQDRGRDLELKKRR